MHRNITWTSADYYCRYLDAGILRNDHRKPCGGRIGKFLKQLGLEKLPGNISLGELLNNDVVSFDLCVKVPKELYGYCPHFQDELGGLEDEFGDFLYYSLAFPSIEINSPQDLLHPYDDPRDLKSRFKERFQAAEFELLEPMDCSGDDRRRFIPYEFYFCYWRAYVIIEACDLLMNVEWLSKPEDQADTIYRIFKTRNDEWNEKYATVFDRVSFYKNAKTRWGGSSNHQMTIGEVGSFASNEMSVSTEELCKDLEKLLILHENWTTKIERQGRGLLKLAREWIKLDIFNLFEWILVTSSLTKEDLYQRWDNNGWKHHWTQLSDVVAFEEFKLKDNFTLYFSRYLSDAGVLIQEEDTGICFDRLNLCSSFKPWCRAFNDIHEEFKKSSPTITFNQPRFIEHLIVLTIRTEVLIRRLIAESRLGIEKVHLRKVFTDVSQRRIVKRQDRKILKEISGDDWMLTYLSEMPPNIFEYLADIKSVLPDSLSQRIHLEVLKFVTARNYFAHHSYKDEEFRYPTSAIGREIIVACLTAVYFIDNLIVEVDH